MRKSFIILSSSLKLKRLRKIQTSNKRTSKHNLGQKSTGSHSVVILSEEPKPGPSKQRADFGPTQRELVYDDADIVSTSQGKRQEKGCGVSRRGHNKKQMGKKSNVGDISRSGNKRKRGEVNSADVNYGNVMRKNRDVTASSKGGALKTKKNKGSDEKGKGRAGKAKVERKKPEKVQKARKRAKKDEFPGIRTRSSPLQFYKCVRALTEQQRDAVREMGFGRMLTFSVDGLPAKLGYFVVDNFNPDKMLICTPAGDIMVNRKVIHKLLGIPTGGQKFSSIGKLPMVSDAITEWRARYPGAMVPPTKMVKMIDDSDGEDSFDFRMDFIMCFVAVLVDCHKQSCLREEILEYLDEEMDFATIDWCDFVVEKLRTCKDTWNRLDPQSFFVGPLAILMLLYVDSVECTGMEVDSAVCPLAFWNFKRLRERERLEILAGGFGTGRFKGLTRPRNYNVEQWATKEERLTILRQLICVTKKNKVKIEGMLDSLLVESHEDEEVQELKSTFDSLFEKKDSEREDHDDAADLASHKINSVLEDLRSDEKNHINEGENAGDGIDDDFSDGSPIVSLYRKSLIRQNKKISKSRLKAVGSSAIDFDDQEADVQVQSFANDGVEDYDEQIEDGGKSVEVRRSARLENLKHVRETEEMFVTPKRYVCAISAGGWESTSR